MEDERRIKKNADIKVANRNRKLGMKSRLLQIRWKEKEE